MRHTLRDRSSWSILHRVVKSVALTGKLEVTVKDLVAAAKNSAHSVCASNTFGVQCRLRAAAAADIVGLQQPDGSFAGDKWGEIDTR